MKFLILLALVGSICALQYPVEYRYKYSGRLATSIPAIREQVSATGIEAELTLQMKSRTQGIAKLTSIKVGHFHGDANCVELRQPLPIHYSELKKYTTEFQEPFGVNFAEELGHVMTVPKEDIEFITNIRKSIVGILRVDPVINNLAGSKKDPITSVSNEELNSVKVYSLEEESIFGRCESQYTLTRIPSYLAKREMEEIKKHLITDEQTQENSRGNVPAIGEKLWRLVKAVSFDKCHDQVILQHSGISNSSKAGHGQWESLQSRSNVATYILRGSEKSFRIERATVEGDIVLNPFGYKLERLHMMTNQTLQLKSAKSIEKPLRLPSSTRTVRTWRYEVASPFSAPAGTPKPWVNYYNKGERFAPVPALGHILGFYENKEDIAQYKDKVVEILGEIVEEVEKLSLKTESKKINQERPGLVATSRMIAVTKMLRRLTVNDIEHIFEQIFRQKDVKGQKKQMLLIDIVAASGAAPPMKVLLERIEKGEISKNRIVSIFMTLTNHLVSPVIVPELMKYAMKLDVEREPFVASAVLINFATLAHRVCLSHSTHNFSVPNPIFGKEACRAEPILNEFLPHLISKAKSASADWQKAIYIEAASSLATPHVITALRKYITGEARLPLKVRLISVYALSRRKMPASVREEVFDLLMGIVDNVKEDQEIRQAAMAVLLSWHPDSAWWQRMARLTWREPSPSMAAFFTFTVQKMALSTDPRLEKQASIAAFVLPLMKPFSRSTKYSFNYIYSRFDPASKIVTNGRFAFLENLESVLPSELYASLRNSFGGLDVNLFELIISAEGLEKPFYELLDLFHLSKSESRDVPINHRDSSSRRREEDRDVESRHQGEPKGTIYMRVFDHITGFFPINKDTLKKLAGTDAERLLKELLKGMKVNATKYVNPMDIQYFVPTELGLPVIGSASLPTLNMGNAEVRLEISGSSRQPSLKDLLKAKKVHLLFKSYYKFVSKAIVSLKTIVPWEENIIEAEVHNYREVNLPVYGNLTYQHSRELKNLTLNLAPYTKQEFPVIYASNIPMTTIKPIALYKRNVNSKVIAVARDSQEPLVNVRENANTEVFGMKASLWYKGDKPSPFARYYLLDFLRKPEKFFKLLFTPTSKQWEAQILIDPRESSTKNISLSLSYLTPENSEGSDEELIRTPKSLSDRRRSQNVPDFSVTDSQSKRLEKMRELSAGNQVRALNLQLVLNGTEFKKYEAIVAFTKTSHEESPKKEFRTLLALLSMRKESEPKAYCLEADTETPEVESFKNLERDVSSGMKSTIKGRLYHGRSCAAKSIVTFEGNMKMSEERKRSVKAELDGMCNYDQRNPVVELQTEAVYDEGRIEFDFEKNDLPKPFLNMTYTVEKLLEGLVYPHGYYNRMDIQNSENKLTIEAKRPLASKYYTFWAQKPKENVIIEELPIPDILTRIVPFLGLRVRKNAESELVLTRETAQPSCVIENGRVNTFDGLDYDYSPLNCYTVAVTERNTDQDFVVYSRKDSNDNIMIRVLFQSEDVEVILTKDDATVNGQTVPSTQSTKQVKGRSGKVLMVIHKRSSHYEAEIHNKLEIVVTEKTVLVPSFRMKNQLRGLCGDFDGTPTHDLTGPKLCLYTDVELFKYAWTIEEGERCDTDDLRRWDEKVREYQSHCERRPIRSGSQSLSYDDEESRDECYEYVYPIQDKVRGKDICVAKEPVRKCASHCRRTKKTTVERESKCWEENSAPSEVKEALEKGYLKHKTSEPAKYSKTLDLVAAKECVNKD